MIDFANCLHLMEGLERVLVICPLSVVGVWEEEIPKHTPDELLGKIEWQVVNYERTYARAQLGAGMWTPVANKGLAAYRPQLVVVDESHRIGNPTAAQSRHAYRLGQGSRYRVILTGTMFHRKPFYVFGQAKFYDPSIFGTAFGKFKERIAIFGGFGNYKVMRYKNLKWMMRMMRSFVYIENYVQTHTVEENVLWFHLTGTNLTQYHQMEKESFTKVRDEVIDSPNVLARHLRCQMIAGGWLKGDSKYLRVGNDKYRMAVDRFQQYADEGIDKVVVGCRFRPELVDAAKAAKAAGYRVVLFHGGVKAKDRAQRIRDFRDGGSCAFICQIATAREGIDLSAASTMMFYSLTEDYVSHDQFKRRIEIYGDKRTLQYDYLVARGTRDEVTYRALELKQDVATYLISNPAEVERITAAPGML